MKKPILLLAALLFSSLAQAQLSVGLSTGYTRNELYTNISDYAYNHYQKEGGFVIGVPVQYTVRDWFAIQAEPGFIQKAFSLWQTIPSEPETHLTTRYNYLQLPLMAHFSFGAKKWRGFVNLGGYASYWLSGSLKGTVLDGFNYTYPVFSNLTQDMDGKYTFDSRRDRRLQAGWLAGLGLQYTCNKKVDVFAEGRYYSDQTDQQKDYMRNQVPRYNLTTTITVGILYHFPFSKKSR